MCTIIRMTKYLMYGVFVLLFLMSMAFFGQEPEWAWLTFNAPALLYISVRMLFVVFKHRRPWAITILLIAVGCLEIVLSNKGYTPMGFHAAMIYAITQLVKYAWENKPVSKVSFGEVKNDNEMDDVSCADFGQMGDANFDPTREYQ